MNDYKDHIRRSLGLTEAQFIPAFKLKTEDFPGIDPKEPQISPTARPTPIIALGIRGSSSGGLPSGVDQGRQDISPSKVGGYDRVSPQNLNHHTFDKTPSNPEIKQTAPVNPDPSTGQGVTHPHQIQVTAHEVPQAATGASTDSDPTLKLRSAVPKGIDIDITAEGGAESDEEVKNEDNNTAMIPATSLSETFERNKDLMRERLGLKKCPCGCEKGKCTCPPDCKCKKTGVCECATCGCGDPNDTHGKKDAKVGWGTTMSGECGICGRDHPTDQCTEPGAKAQYKKDSMSEDKKPRVCFHCKKPHPCACDKKDEDDAKLQRNNPEEYRKRFGMKIDKRSDLDPRDRGETVECKNCHNPFNYRLVAEISMGAVKCPACDAVLNQEGIVLAEGKHKAGCQCGFCKNKGSFGKKKDKEKEVTEGDDEDNQGDNPEFKEKHDKQWRKDRSASKAGDDVRAEFDKDKKKVDEQQRLDESYAAPFQRMRSLAGVGNMILTSNGLMENKNDPGANKPFNTNWKMDKEKAGFVKIDEEKLNKVKASLERKSKRGTLSDDEYELAKKITEVLKKRGINEGQKDLDKKLADMKGRKDKERASADDKKNMDRLEKEKRRDDLA